MTEYAKLVLAEATCHTIEIKETGKKALEGVCIFVYYFKK